MKADGKTDEQIDQFYSRHLDEVESVRAEQRTLLPFLMVELNLTCSTWNEGPRRPLGLCIDLHDEEQARNRETKKVVDDMENWTQEQLDADIRKSMLEIEQNLDDSPDSIDLDDEL